jgi:hypothetical protein
MDTDKKITKIVISKEDELTDIVTAILDSRNERIVLTFAEETDLLISPINLKVLLETADEAEKLLIAQIIKNPTGLRNAKLANLSAIDSPQFPEEDVWEIEELNRAKRLSPPKKKPVKKEPEPIETEDTPSDFQKRIDAAIAKSKESVERKEGKEDDVLITLDEDLPGSDSSELEITRLDEEQDKQRGNEKVGDKERKEGKDSKTGKVDENKTQPNLSKVDFSKKTEDPIKTKQPRKEKKPRGQSKTLKKLFLGIGGVFKKISLPPKLKRLFPILAISLLLLAILIGFIYLNTALLVRVRIYVEAKEVSIEQVFQGDENIKEINFEEFKIPVKTESVEKSRSSNVRATGTAFRGEKATGEVNITYIVDGCDEDTEPLELPAEHPLSTGGKTYTFDSNTQISCTTLTVASITAIEVGEEYNLPQGRQFTVQGYSTAQLVVINNSGAITGGSKEEYTVLSKADVDAAIESLSQIAIKEGEDDLRDLSGTWEIIPDSITSQVLPDSTKTDAAIGAEATNVNLSITTRSTASYFLKEGFDDGVEELLTNQAKNENLFETDKDWQLELDEDIEKEISVVESNAQGISIKLVAKSTVKPRVDTEDILSDLKEKNWEDGVQYLKDLEFSDRETRVEFFPEWFPESLKRFPRRQGGVLISIGDVN